MMKFGVIIPTADREKLLKRAIHSLLIQSHRPDEIIVVDNGRMELNVDFFQNEPLITVVRTAPLIGPGKSRNVGAKHAQSDLVAFLDDDDIWLENYIEETLRLFKSDQADVVVGRLDRQDIEGSTRAYKMFPASPTSQRSVFYKNPGFGGQNFAIKRYVFLKLGGFDEKMPASVDRDLAARLLIGGYKISVAPNAVAVLCDHTGERVRYNQLRGNRMFICKHWRHMSFIETTKASITFVKRWLKFRLNRHAIK